ncbi:MAG: DNA recombination/repair protein RecA, partial [Lachnospiraceae bacterium]|nr:DNA recombination/repair protein RecA [Lachnospiraceae bacterium]
IMFGNPEVTTGGRALKFYSTMRFDVRRVESIKTGDKVVGNRTRVKIVKNKVAPPFRQTEFDIIYGKGINKTGDVLDCAVEAGLLEKSGAWYSLNGERIGQGRENAKTFLDEHPEIVADLEAKLKESMRANKTQAPTPEDMPGFEVDEDGVIQE